MRRAAAAPERVGDDDRAAERRPEPEARAGPLVREPGGGDGGREWQESGQHRAVRGRYLTHRVGGQQRESDDHPQRDDREVPELRDRRPRAARRGERGRGQDGGDDRAAQADEHGIEVLDRRPGRGERDAEGGHADQSPRQAHAAVMVGGRGSGCPRARIGVRVGAFGPLGHPPRRGTGTGRLGHRSDSARTTVGRQGLDILVHSRACIKVCAHISVESAPSDERRDCCTAA